MKKNEVKKLISKTRKIKGWFSLEAGLLIAALNECQNNHNIDGDIFEIGVHHGKSTVFFANLLIPSQSISICDIFDSQEDNISNSGSGDKVKLLRNISAYSKFEIKNIFSCLSSELDISRIGDNFRMFHIDGGHDKSEALTDLILASQAIHDKGIIIVDDPFRAAWPGVTEALIDFLKNYSVFTAIFVGFNKLIICKNEASDLYLDFIDNFENRKKYDLRFPYRYKKHSFVNANIRIFYTLYSINPKSFRIKLVKVIIDSKIYKWLEKNLTRNKCH